MDEDLPIIVFRLDDQRHGLKLAAVERVTRIAEISVLPQAPGMVLGLVNVGGKIIPVVDIRRRFHLPAHPIGLNDQLILTHTTGRVIALVADEVDGIRHCDTRDLFGATTILPDLRGIDAVLRLPNGLLLIHNPDTLLSLDEEHELFQALNAHGAQAVTPHPQAASLSMQSTTREPT